MLCGNFIPLTMGSLLTSQLCEDKQKFHTGFIAEKFKERNSQLFWKRDDYNESGKIRGCQRLGQGNRRDEQMTQKFQGNDIILYDTVMLNT